MMSRSCKECVHHNPDFIDKVCLSCSWPEFAGEPSNFKPKPTTNYDRFRAITAEELARWLALHPCLPNCPAQTEMRLKESKLENCAKRWLDWLKQEASK